MFTPAQRDRTRAQLLARAEADESIVGFALTGSHATGDGDRWSDTDIVVAVRGGVADAVARWTADLRRVRRPAPLGPRRGWRHGHPGVPAAGVDGAGPHLRPGVGVRRPQWRTVFGSPQAQPPFAPPDRDTLVGFAWHHALHARIRVERDRPWQAAHWINALRDQLIALACLRLDLPTAYSKGARLLPAEVTTPLEPTLVRSLAAPELRRAPTATITAATAELDLSAPESAPRLRPMLGELTQDT